jgi:SOS-response transcriptional repressor LexA
MRDEEAAALVAAGRLLQSKQWPGGKREIKRAPGETYPSAVLRVIQTLDESERAKLRELTEWVRAYEKADELYK